MVAQRRRRNGGERNATVGRSDDEIRAGRQTYGPQLRFDRRGRRRKGPRHLQDRRFGILRRFVRRALHPRARIVLQPVAGIVLQPAHAELVPVAVKKSPNFLVIFSPSPDTSHYQLAIGYLMRQTGRRA